MEHPSPIRHSGKDISDHAAYELLKHALTPKTSKSTNSEQKPEQKRAVLAAVERMRQVRQHRTRVAELDASMADEFTLGAQENMANVYLNYPPDHVNKLSADMALLLVQLIQRWCDEDFVAALNSDNINKEDAFAPCQPSTE